MTNNSPAFSAAFRDLQTAIAEALTERGMCMRQGLTAVSTHTNGHDLKLTPLGAGRSGGRIHPGCFDDLLWCVLNALSPRGFYSRKIAKNAAAPLCCEAKVSRQNGGRLNSFLLNLETEEFTLALSVTNLALRLMPRSANLIAAMIGQPTMTLNTGGNISLCWSFIPLPGEYAPPEPGTEFYQAQHAPSFDFNPTSKCLPIPNNDEALAFFNDAANAERSTD